MNAGLQGAVLVSDGFFPFRDGVDAAIREGARGVIQPGGSERDYEVIEACNEQGVTMVFAGQRLFKH
jgi:phosphoribosylaminoimidazolecarboxamide formyltransferase/IMP cyclohydrolase